MDMVMTVLDISNSGSVLNLNKKDSIYLLFHNCNKGILVETMVAMVLSTQILPTYL